MSKSREAIARIIAPEVWAQHDRFGKFTAYTQGMAPSLEKADAILALIDASTASTPALTSKED